MPLMNRAYRKDPNIVSRKIADEVILVPIKRRLADVNSIYLLPDDVSLRIWELIDGRRRVREIKEAICAEFNISPEQAQSDLVEFLGQLEKVGGITRET